MADCVRSSSESVQPPLVIVYRFISLAAVVALLSCNRLEERESITETREISTHARKPALDVPSWKRFYGEDPATAKEEPSAPREHPLVWRTPDGWTEKPPAQMRLIDLRFGPNEEGECYVSAMPGAAGGLAANLNRWRAQMGQPALTEEQIEKLPRKMFLGAPAHYMEVDGAFTAVGEQEAKADYRMIGIIHPASELTLFVKMTGPRAVIEQQTAAFDAFCQSVAFRRRVEATNPSSN